MMSNWKWYMGDILESFVWLSMDHSKDIYFTPLNTTLPTTVFFFLVKCKISSKYKLFGVGGEGGYDPYKDFF
jgi:hypothetical protein